MKIKNTNTKQLLENDVIKNFLKENNLLQQLNEKSVFSFTNNVLNIDFNGDGVFDTQINCLMNNGNIVGCHSQEPKNQDLAQSLNSWLKNNYGDNLGFSFSESIFNNNSVFAQNSTNNRNINVFPQNNYANPQINSQQFSYLNKSNQMFDVYNSISSLNIPGMKVELLDIENA